MQLDKAAGRESRADQQRHRDRDLPNNQQAPQSAAVRAGATRAILEGAEERTTTGQARPRSEEQPGEERYRRRENENWRADANFIGAGKERRGVCFQGVQSPGCERQTSKAAEEREQDVLGDQLLK